MDRMEQLAAVISEPLQQKFLAELDQILLSVQNNIQQIKMDLRQALQDVFDQAGKIQAVGGKGAVAYVSFSLMQSSLLLDRYALQIDAYDERFFVDDKESSAEWDFSVLLQDLNQDFSEETRILRQSVHRVMEYELWELQKAYQLNYFAAVIGLLPNLLAACLDKFSLNDTAAMSEVQFTIGPYMEQQMPFYQWRRAE